MTEWKFGFVDDRFDEALVMTIGKRQYPHMWVFDKETNRSYSWDKYVKDINQTTIRDWILNKEYRNSILQFETPISMWYVDIYGL